MLKALAIPLLVFGTFACSWMGMTKKNEVRLTQSTLAPAADAKAKISLDKNDNARVDLKVKDLAEPGNLQPPKQTYAVWAQTEDGTNYLLGRLDVNENGSGQLKSTVPAKTFRILVTAEDVVKPQEPPSKEVVLSSNYVSAPR